MLGALHRAILIPAFESGWKRRATFRHWRELERTQWLPMAQIEARQLDALKRLVAHAHAHCAYYRQAWARAGLDPGQVTRLADFGAWPIIDRATIREHRPAMRAPGRKLLAKSTGGSSGVPLQFDLDEDADERHTAAAHRAYAWAGAGPGSKQFFLWGGQTVGRPFHQRIKDRVYEALYRRTVMSAFQLTEGAVPEILKALERGGPDVIVGYTNSLYSLAVMADERRLRPFSPRAIVVGAEKLHSFQRDRLESVFGAKVFETYGSREFMLIAAECDRHEGLHLTAEQLLVEVLDEDGRPAAEGQEGDLVITDLFNYGMPFIRYANGDRAVAGWGKCSCGRGLPLLRSIVGRRLDILTTMDGRRIPGEFFPHLIKDFPAVRRFQVVQPSREEVVLRLVAAGEGRDSQIARIESAARAALGPQVRFSIAIMDTIPLTAAGKLQVVVNAAAEPGPDAITARP